MRTIEQIQAELLAECYDTIMRLRPHNPGLGSLAFRLRNYRHTDLYGDLKAYVAELEKENQLCHALIKEYKKTNTNNDK